MIAIVTISGFAGVITEVLLKNKPFVCGRKMGGIGGSKSTKSEEVTSPKLSLSIWDRNIQLAFWSIVFGAGTLMLNGDIGGVEGNGIFEGWSQITMCLVVLWTMGGLLVAMTIKYTDVIIKGFASAVSLIVICIAGNVV